MKKILYYILPVAMATAMTSCWDETDYEAGAPRHQVTNLVGVPGDEEAELSWDMPDGWHPTDFIITYTDANNENITERTGGTMVKLYDNLTNGYAYTFNVQAVYGTNISNAVSVKVTPSTSRFAIKDLTADASSESVFLAWTKPGTGVTGYTLNYYPEATPADVTTVTIPADATTYLIEGLVNDTNYIVELTANYPKGPSDKVSMRVMPTEGIPYILSSMTPAVGRPMTFSLDREVLPNATDITWTFPGGVERKGDVVEYAFTAPNAEAKVTLSANTGHRVQSWDIYLPVREYVVFCNEWDMDAGQNYNGFKGTCPVFSPDGKTVYIITFNKISNLYAFDLETGELSWVFKPATATGSYNMLTVNPVNGDIYYGTTTAGEFYCVKPDGELRWKFTEAKSMQSAAPAVNKAGDTLYIVDNAGNLFAINAADGAKIWSAVMPGQGSGLLVNGSELVVGVANAKAVTFVDVATGNTIKQLSFAKGMTAVTGFAVSLDGSKIYVPHQGGAMSCVDINTHEIVVNSFKVSSLGADLYEPIVGPNGDVFVGSKDSHYYIVDGALTTVKCDKLALSAQANNAFNFAHPVVTADNKYLVSTGQEQNRNFIIDPTGNILDQWQYGSDKQKQMGGNNFIDGVLFSAFIGVGGDSGIFVGKYVGGERAAWCASHGCDICGSCCLK